MVTLTAKELVVMRRTWNTDGYPCMEPPDRPEYSCSYQAGNMHLRRHPYQTDKNAEKVPPEIIDRPTGLLESKVQEREFHESIDWLVDCTRQATRLYRIQWLSGQVRPSLCKPGLAE